MALAAAARDRAAAWLLPAASRALASKAGHAADPPAIAVTAARVAEIARRGADDPTATSLPGQVRVGELRSSSALCVGDGIAGHTPKWWQPELGGTQASPLEFCQAAPPIKVHGAVVASYGSDDPALGCPVEYINLKGTSRENPAVCKYTGNKYYSDDWAGGH